MPRNKMRRLLDVEQDISDGAHRLEDGHFVFMKPDETIAIKDVDFLTSAGIIGTVKPRCIMVPPSEISVSMKPWTKAITRVYKNLFNSDHVHSFFNHDNVLTQFSVIYASSHSSVDLGIDMGIALSNPNVIYIFIAGDDSLLVNFCGGVEERDMSTFENSQRTPFREQLLRLWKSIGVPDPILELETRNRRIVYTSRNSHGITFYGDAGDEQSSGSDNTTLGNGTGGIMADIFRISNPSRPANECHWQSGFVSKVVRHESILGATFLKHFFVPTISNDGTVTCRALPLPGMIFYKIPKISVHPLLFAKKAFPKLNITTLPLAYAAISKMIVLSLPLLPSNMPLVGSLLRLLDRFAASIGEPVNPEFLSSVIESGFNPMYRDARESGQTVLLSESEINYTYDFIFLRYGVSRVQAQEFEQALDNYRGPLPLLITHPVYEALFADYA